MYNYYLDEKKNKERENQDINKENLKLKKAKRKSNSFNNY